MENFSDEQLVKSYLAGNDAAMDILVLRHMAGIYNFVFKYVHDRSTAEDVTQDAFLKIWKNIKKFKSQYKFKTWAYTIAKNTALDQLKRKGFVAIANEQGEPEDLALSKALVSEDPLPEELMMKLDDAALVSRSLAKLPGKYREILDLYYLKQLNFREISELLRQSINTIKTRHRRAVMQLKKIVIK